MRNRGLNSGVEPNTRRSRTPPGRKILTDLRLETPSILDGKTQGNEILDTLLSHDDDEDGLIFCTVAFLTAFASQSSPEGTIYLASGVVLPRTYCPHFIKLFDLIHRLKSDLTLINIPPQICLRKLMPTLKASAIEAIDTTAASSHLTQYKARHQSCANFYGYIEGLAAMLSDLNICAASQLQIEVGPMQQMARHKQCALVSA